MYLRRSIVCFSVITLTAAYVLPPAAQAGSVEVAVADGRVTVAATEASVDDILSKLGQAHEFKTERLGNGPKPYTLSGRFEGSLDTVLSRILHKESHGIQYSKNSNGGIVRVVLYGPGSPAQAASSPARSYVVPAPSATGGIVPAAGQPTPPPQVKPPHARTRSQQTQLQPQPQQLQLEPQQLQAQQQPAGRRRAGVIN